MRQFLFLILTLAFFAPHPAKAQWTTANPLIDGACSTGAANAEGVVASAVMDRDESVSLVIGITGKRASMFVVNFSDGTDQVFQARSNDNIAFNLTGDALQAFRNSNNFRLYEHNRGFIASPFTLAGSSGALDTLYQCVRQARREQTAADAGSLTGLIPDFELFGVKIGMSQSEVVGSLETANFQWRERTSAINANGPNGEDLTIYFRNGSSGPEVKRFFVVVSSARTNVTGITTMIEDSYGPHSTTHSFAGHRIWYRTSDGHLLSGLREQYPCPNSAQSRLVLRETRVGNRYLSGAGGSVTAPADKYEVAVDDCTGD